METKLGRLGMLDALRGFTVLSMAAYHFLFDLNVVFGRDTLWASAPIVHFWQQCICWGFILISGFTWPMGRAKNLRRGLILNLWGLVITAVTYIALPEQAIYFGILSFLGCAVLLLTPLDKPLQRLKPGLGLGLSFTLFLCLRRVLPGLLPGHALLVPLGLPHESFYSSDYFPLLPWFMLYLCGYFLHGIFASHPGWTAFFRRDIPLLGCIGRRALPLYLIHQPLFMLILTVANSGVIINLLNT
jgi:uncharacterized membrane protein